MDNFKMLIDVHSNLRKLEKIMKEQRINLIKEYKNRSSSDSNWYCSKISFTAFAVEFKKETAKFEKLLNELDEIKDGDDDEINMDGLSVLSDSNSNSDENDEIMNNLESSECDLSSAPSSSGKAYSNLLNDSVPVTENLDVDQTQIMVENEEKEKEKEKETEEPSNDAAISKPKNSVSNIEECRLLSKNNTNKNKKPQKIARVNTGYKYEGKGFTVFTNSRNRERPIYSSTMLHCSETCDGNKKELKDYLVKYGKFKEGMIEDIIFKTSYKVYRRDYALIKVRGTRKYIKNKIKTLNKAKGDVLSIFNRVKYVTAMDYANISNVLYVNNFDILRRDTHRRFTKLFLRFGDLSKDIYMGLDKQQKDPFAIVHFKDVNDAKRCFEKQKLAFDGKVLNIKFSKF